MQNFLFLKSKNKNLTWNHDINSVLFAAQNKQNLVFKPYKNVGSLIHGLVKQQKNVNFFMLIKILILSLKIDNHTTWKIFFGQINTDMNQALSHDFVNHYYIKTLLYFLKNNEPIFLYSNIQLTPSFHAEILLNNWYSHWIKIPENTTSSVKKFSKIKLQENTNINFLKTRSLKYSNLNIKFQKKSPLINNSWDFYQHENNSDFFLNLKLFNNSDLKLPMKTAFLELKLEQKLEALIATGSSTKQIQNLLQIYNYIRNTNRKTYIRYFAERKILGQADLISKLKNIAPEIFFQFLQTKFKKTKKSDLIWAKNFNHKNMRVNNIAIKGHALRLNIAKMFTGKKLVIQKQYFFRKNTNKVLDALLNANTKIFYINALSIAKFGFMLEKQKDNTFLQNLSMNPSKFLNNLDREMISKYKYIGVYIKDLIRVCFIALFLKKPAFLAKFIAFQISVLPKNRRETSFVRFLIKVVKTLAAEREEILGLRLKFKGRVNRWRRTKVILGQRGILPLHTINNRIEYGTAQAINRKGALGVHIWIWYNPLFKSTLKETYIQYFKYSNYLNTLQKY